MDDKLPSARDMVMGFERYIRSSVEDVPLIRPPKRHMVAQITCGLKKLYELIKEAEAAGKTNGDLKRKDQNDSSKGRLIGKGGLEKDNKSRKKEDEGGGEDEENEETSPYTDEDGEFIPDESIPLLACRYKYVEIIARGQSALIVKALDTFAEKRVVAIKVLHRVYKPIGGQEADILLEVHKADPWLYVPFARLQNQFVYGPHYCLVFEFLSPTPIYTHYDKWDIRGPASLPYARKLCIKLLTVMGFLHKQNVIHADLKPANILLSDEKDASSIMVIDFGNALRNTEEELSLYYSDFELQTLLYRAPEVIFGLKFSLEIDMWSFGCLLAECYTGEPLFMAKTKHAILKKITELLGPFPKEFGEGECADEFMEFIGRPLSGYQRVENLRKRMNNCVDSHFLLLLDRLLTYSPRKRITPFEAACHPFVAYATPFLYLGSPTGEKMYPTVLFDSTTYPYAPKNNEEEEENQTYIRGRKRLATFNKPTEKAESKIHNDIAKVKEKEKEKEKPKFPPTPQPKLKGAVEAKSSPSVDNESSNVSSSGAVASLTPSTKLKVTQAQQGKLSHLQSQVAGGNISRTDVKQTLKSMGLRCEDFTISVHSKEQTHAMLKKQGVEVTNHASATGPVKPIAMLPKAQPMVPPMHHPRPRHQQPMHFDSNFPHPRVVGRPRGRPPMRPSVSVMRSEMPQQPIRPMVSHRPLIPPMASFPPPSNTSSANQLTSTPKKVSPNPSKEKDKEQVKTDDDDDCIILDDSPPTKTKPSPLSPRGRFPHQFQLMGTTVQVNRGAKRTMRGMHPHGPMHKRPAYRFPRGGGRLPPQYYYNDAQAFHAAQQQEESSEASVQDTLKRLQNYNISITCRRNSKTKADSEDDMEGNPDSDEDDMSRYLSCEIDEDERAHMEDEENYEEFDSSSSLAEVSFEEGKESGANDKDKLPTKDGKEKRVVKEGRKLNDTVELPDDDDEEIKEKESDDNKSKTAATTDVKEKDEQKTKEIKPKEGKPVSPKDEPMDESPKKVVKDSTAEEEKKSDDDKHLNLMDVFPNESEGTTENGEAAFLDTFATEKMEEVEDLEDEIPNLTKVLNESNIITEGVLSDIGLKSPKLDLEAPIKSPKFSPRAEAHVPKKVSMSSLMNKSISPPMSVDGVNAGKISRNQSKSIDDDEINEELEKQLLESGALGDEDYEGEDLDNECLENLELENAM